MSNYFYFISRIIVNLDFDDNENPLHNSNIKFSKEMISSFCEALLARVDDCIDFYLLDLTEGKEIKPIKFITGTEISPYTGNLIQLGDIVFKRLSFLSEENYLGMHDGDGYYIAFRLRENNHWDYNFLKASSYMEKSYPDSNGCFEIFGYSPYEKKDIIYTSYEFGEYEDGYMPEYDSNGRTRELRYMRGSEVYRVYDILKPAMFTPVWYGDVVDSLKNTHSGNIFNSKTFLFTGTLSNLNRSESEMLVENLGGKVLSGVSGKLDYLVVGEDPGSKVEKAKKIPSVKIISESEFLEMVKQDSSEFQNLTPVLSSSDNDDDLVSNTDSITDTSRFQINVNELIEIVCVTLDEIITLHLKDFKKKKKFDISSWNNYGKFYLDKIEGSYAMSLQSLIHFIMLQKGIYRRILSSKQYDEVVNLIKDYPDAIYGLSDEDEDYEMIQEKYINPIYSSGIAFVGRNLVAHGFDVNETFAEYINPDNR
jgi:hypothetical protein